MIPAGVQVFVALEPVDMRCGFDRLAAMVRERMVTSRAAARSLCSSAAAVNS
jgi:transposase